ncbi:uncharacterized protein [Amphiura filiformis]|uniref:uncharacterized protein n=1 Tax=Amphiura filiformis TaxID=82378 RepID=UPI003B211D4A
MKSLSIFCMVCVLLAVDILVEVNARLVFTVPLNGTLDQSSPGYHSYYPPGSRRYTINGPDDHCLRESIPELYTARLDDELSIGEETSDDEEVLLRNSAVNPEDDDVLRMPPHLRNPPRPPGGDEVQRKAPLLRNPPGPPGPPLGDQVQRKAPLLRNPPGPPGTPGPPLGDQVQRKAPLLRNPLDRL